MTFQLGKPYLQQENGQTRLLADVKAEGDQFTLWYEVEEKYTQYLVTERCDSFVVGLLPWVMMKAKKLRQNITLSCESRMSAKLWHQLTNYYIPVLSDAIPYYAPILLEAETDAGELPCAGAVGTGVSGGVDSSYTIAKYKDNSVQAYRLTHAVYYNIGIYGGLESNAETKIQILTKQVAQDAGLKYVKLASNVCLTLYRAAHAPIVPAVFISTTLALQKLFTVYYYSSAFIAKDFCLSKSDAAYYDLLNVHCLSTENTTFHSSGIESTRLAKLDFITDVPFAQNNLLVCLDAYKNSRNCGRCAKCSRTMAELEVLGKLDEFRKVFDVDAFRNEEGYHWGYILLKSKDDAFCKEITERYSEKYGSFPLKIRLAALKKWAKRGFTAVNHTRRRVEDEIR